MNSTKSLFFSLGFTFFHRIQINGPILSFDITHVLVNNLPVHKVKNRIISGNAVIHKTDVNNVSTFSITHVFFVHR
jgi:hypothetical protein